MKTSRTEPNRCVTLTDLRAVLGVVLDAVGTLITPSPSVSEVYVSAAARQGVPVNVETIRERFRTSFGHDEEEVGEAREPYATSEPVERRRWQRIVAACLPEVPDPDRAFHELWEHFAQPESWRVYDDVPILLEALADQDRPCRIASNFDARLRPVLRGLASLRHLADEAVISSEIGYRKPDARFFEAACRTLRLPPAAVLHVGDDERNDREGPRRAGMLAIRLDRKNTVPTSGDLPSLADLAARFREAVIGSKPVRRPMT